MNLRIVPAPLTGSAAAIASKSDAHRLLICAALADAPSHIAFASSSQDIDATMDCLRALGAQVERTPGGARVTPVSRPAQAPLLDAGESGSTLRFMLPVAAALCGEARFCGRGRLPERPLDALMDAMGENGAVFSSRRLPFEVRGGLRAGRYTLPGNVSSQYVTGLLLALPLLAGESEITLTTPLESAAYVTMTLRALARFGVRCAQDEAGWRVPGGQRFVSPGVVRVDGDWSNAAFFLAAGALGGPVTVTGLDPESPQGDRAIVPLLERFGARVRQNGGAVQVAPGTLRAQRIDVREIPDLLPALAVVAACAEGETRFTGAARLRLKESDRLESVAALLRALGAAAQPEQDGLIVRGGGLTGGTADSCGDHRIAMAAALAAIRCREPVTILGAGAVAKSYPGFFDDYRQLGGKTDVV